MSLTAIAAVTGVILLLVWKRFSNQERMALAKRQMRARLYALRLYADDPVLVLRAQRQLLLWSARYVAGSLRSTAVAIVPLLALFLQLDHVYGYRPLAPGESVMVTARFSRSADVRTLAAVLEGRGVVIETPAVRIPNESQVCWSVRTATASSGSVLLRVPGEAITQDVNCGHGLLTARWGTPSIDVSCPAAMLDVLGFRVRWPVWFLFVSLSTVLALRSRFGVVL
jgi:hypothetical protein